MKRLLRLVDPVNEIDRGISRHIATMPPSGLDTVMKGLTTAANHSVLWFTVAGALALRRGATRKAAARGLLADAMPIIRDRGCTLVGLSLSNLDDHDNIQLTLPFDTDHAEELDATMDLLKERFGRDSVTRAVLIGRTHGDDAPMLPD